MKSRVISIRVPYSVLANCYAIQDAVSSPLVGKPVGTVVATTLEALVKTACKMYNLQDFTSDAEAIQYIESFADFIPGIELGDDIEDVSATLRVLTTATSTARHGAFNEKPNHRPEEATTQRPTAEPVYPICKDVEQVELKGVDEFAASAEDFIEQAALEEIEKDNRELVESIKLGSVERVSPNVAPATPKCPWDGVEQLSPALLIDDELYAEALQFDELLAVSIRVVYFAVDKKDWKHERTIQLIKDVYENYVKWRAEYAPKKA